jgi:hypothetical protein
MFFSVHPPHNLICYLITARSDLFFLTQLKNFSYNHKDYAAKIYPKNIKTQLENFNLVLYKILSFYFIRHLFQNDFFGGVICKMNVITGI